jgi:hypothetical protein
MFVVVRELQRGIAIAKDFGPRVADKVRKDCEITETEFEKVWQDADVALQSAEYKTA